MTRPASLGLLLAAASFALAWLVHCSSKSHTALGTPTLHRASAQTCSADRPPSVTHDGGFNPNNPYATCHKDAECTQGRNGRCEGVFNSAACACDYDECTMDTDCGGGGACICRTPGYGGPTYCATEGNCLTDADCGSGGYCSPSRVGDTCNPSNVAYYCHTSTDECANDADCDAFPTGGFCLIAAGKDHWQCAPFPACDGGVQAPCQ